MKLIELSKSGNRATIGFFGCPLRCAYCTHIMVKSEDHEIAHVMESLADPAIEEVYIGGAEPTIQKRELMELLRCLRRMNRRITLKTSGNDPAFLKDTIGLVDKYIVEVKCPLDDIDSCSSLIGLSVEKTRRYLDSLRRSLDVLSGQRLRVWIRVIPGHFDEDKIDRIGKQISGKTHEALLYQFMSNPANDAPFEGITEPGPSETEMVSFARQLVRYVPKVIVQGRGFEDEFSSTS
ncbi:MAG: radical SAM protein [Methanomassiliicoccales archaeon]|nr:radical SAM protein [Methanomassiliicoccales archaeon]